MFFSVSRVRCSYQAVALSGCGNVSILGSDDGHVYLYAMQSGLFRHRYLSFPFYLNSFPHLVLLSFFLLLSLFAFWFTQKHLIYLSTLSGSSTRLALEKMARRPMLLELLPSRYCVFSHPSLSPILYFFDCFSCPFSFCFSSICLSFSPPPLSSLLFSFFFFLGILYIN